MKPSSPLTRGCFHAAGVRWRYRIAFPAYAGVFPREAMAPARQRELPCSRGGVSIIRELLTDWTESSPSSRGCFHHPDDGRAVSPVFPARAGVFPTGPTAQARQREVPRSRGGCFRAKIGGDIGVEVFPAHSGVFPTPTTTRQTSSCLPRSRGGGSRVLKTYGLHVEASPLARAYFQLLRRFDQGSEVFPAYVGGCHRGADSGGRDPTVTRALGWHCESKTGALQIRLRRGPEGCR
ncbi:hypothetical protein BJQ89_00190 [Arthrobacter sp. ES1]|nr:hypothetical protein [Arthrobacter sp. ES1]